MLGGLKTADKALIDYMTRRLVGKSLSGPRNAEGREELAQHLAAMLALNDGHEPPVGLNESLVAEAQRNLARLSVSQRAYALRNRKATRSRRRTGSRRKSAATISPIFSRPAPASRDEPARARIQTNAGFPAPSSTA